MAETELHIVVFYHVILSTQYFVLLHLYIFFGNNMQHMFHNLSHFTAAFYHMMNFQH